MNAVSVSLDQLAAESRWLQRLARSLVNDPALADDLVQDTYLVAAERAPGDGRPLGPWLVRVMVNLTRMRSRSGNRRRAREHAVASLAPPASSPAELVDRVQVQRLLAGLVLDLAPALRDVVLLHDVEGLTSAAIATRLGIAPGTVRWRLKLAHDELRDRLEHHQPNRAWMASLVAFADPAPKAGGAAILWLVAVALGLLLASGWLVTQLGPSDGRLASDRNRERLAPGMRGANADRAPGAAATASSLPSGVTQHGLERIEGRVVDAQGSAVAGAEVTLDCSFGDGLTEPAQRSSASGGFAFGVDAGCFGRLVAEHGELAGHAVVIAGGRRPPLIVELVPRTPIVVRVIDAEQGRPVPGAEVVWSQVGARTDEATTSGDDGVARLRVRGVAKRTFKEEIEIEAHARDRVPARLTLDLASEQGRNAPIERTLRLGRGIPVRGQVVGSDGHAIPDARVALAPSAAGLLDRGDVGLGARVDGSGRFELAVPGPGRYRAVASAASRVAAFAELEVNEEGLSGVVLRVTRRQALEITGTVVDRAGAPVAGARISCPPGDCRPVVTDDRGRFAARMTGLLGGVASMPGESSTYYLVARHGALASTFVRVEAGRGQPATARLELGPAGIAGIAVDAEGAPVPSAQVWLNDCCEDRPGLQKGKLAVADADGRFWFDVPRGAFRLSVRRTGDDDYLDQDDRVVTGGSHDVRLVVP